MAFVSFHGW